MQLNQAAAADVSFQRCKAFINCTKTKVSAVPSAVPLTAEQLNDGALTVCHIAGRVPLYTDCSATVAHVPTCYWSEAGLAVQTVGQMPCAAAHGGIPGLGNDRGIEGVVSGSRRRGSSSMDLDDERCRRLKLGPLAYPYRSKKIEHHVAGNKSAILAARAEFTSLQTHIWSTRALRGRRRSSKSCSTARPAPDPQDKTGVALSRCD